MASVSMAMRVASAGARRSLQRPLAPSRALRAPYVGLGRWLSAMPARDARLSCSGWRAPAGAVLRRRATRLRFAAFASRSGAPGSDDHSDGEGAPETPTSKPSNGDDLPADSPFRRVETAETAVETFWTIPNMLTMTRVVATPGLAWLCVAGHYDWAVFGFAAAGFCDWLDGWAARKFNQSTIMGSLLDPLADKLLVGVLGVTLAAQGELSAPLVGLILFRDVGLICGAFYHRYRTWPPGTPFFQTSSSSAFKVQPTAVSKANTALQIGLIGFAMCHAAWGMPPQLVVDGVSALVAVTTIWTGYDYLRAYREATAGM